MESVRVGIVGTSSFVQRVHLPFLATHSRAILAAICARDLERARAVAAEYAISRLYSRFDDLISERTVDAVLIATPDDLHYPMTMAALGAGLHVLCEKPLALRAAEARAMLHRAEETRLTHLVFFRWRWLPHYEHVHRLVDDGWIGRPLRWEFHYLSESGFRPGYAWRFDESRANGALGDLGSHMIDLACWLGGRIRRVSADLAVTVSRLVPEGNRILLGNDNATLRLEFESGAEGIVRVSAVEDLGGEPQVQRVMAVGDEGRLAVEFRRSTGAVLHGSRGAGRPEPLAVPGDVPDGEELFDVRLRKAWGRRSVADRLFIDGIVNGRSVAPSFEDGLRVQEVIDAAFESHRSRSWVAIG